MIEGHAITHSSPFFVTQTEEVPEWLIVVTGGDRAILCALIECSFVSLLAVIMLSRLGYEKDDLILSNKQCSSNCVP